MKCLALNRLPSRIWEHKFLKGSSESRPGGQSIDLEGAGVSPLKDYRVDLFKFKLGVKLG